MWPQSMHQFWLGKVLINERVNLFTLGRFQRRCKPGLSHVPGTGRAFRQAGHESAWQPSKISSGRELLVKFPRVWGTRNLIEAFPNAFMGVLLPDGCFDRMPKLRRGQKFEWLYDECLKRKKPNSVIDVIGGATRPSVFITSKRTKTTIRKLF